MPREFTGSPGFVAARAALALPEPWIRRIVGPAVERDGRTLSPSVQLMLRLEKHVNALSGGGDDPSARRTRLRRSAEAAMPRVRGVHAVERSIPGPGGPIRLRVYRSAHAPAAPPAIVFLHGGGWVSGDLDTHDGSARMLARETCAVVVAVDYRRAPEHRYPAALDDALAAFRWVHENWRDLASRPGAVAVMGDSAGGNLAAALCLRTRDEGGPTPVAQGLVYPATDLRLGTESMATLADGFFLTRANIEWFIDQYAPDPMLRTDPYLSPLLAPDLAGLPPAQVWTAGFDPLRDEGRAFADALAAAGVPAGYRCLDDQVHGFFGMGMLPDGLDQIAAVCRDMGALLASVSTESEG